jgi:hypothetical protein
VRTRIVLVTVAVLALAGCGGHSNRSAIADYITRVDDIERAMTGPLQEVTVADRKFARAQGDPSVETKLAASVATLRRLRHRLAAVQAPHEAAHMRALLLGLVDNEVSLAVEVYRLAVFVPRYHAALRPLQPASGALKTELATSAKGAAATKTLDAKKADALVAYAQTLGSVAADALAKAIRTNDAAIPHLLERFDAAAVANQSIAAQKRQIGAVKQYDERIRALGHLAQRVQLARVALQRQYG